uniref:Uncharacterized protein n=1 Tax=Plectus sambesii TaxID=2011161 RepID=A0A914XJJ8_9BILA
MAKTDDPSWLAENGKKEEKLFIVISVLMLIVYGVIVGVATKYTTLINDVSTPLSAFLDATEALSFNNNNNDAYFSLSEKEKHIAKPYITSLWLLNSLAFTGIVISFVAVLVQIIAIWKQKHGIHTAALVITIFNGLWSLGLFIPLAFEYMCGRDLPRQLSSLMENAARHNPKGERQLFDKWDCMNNGDSASCETFISNSILPFYLQAVLGAALTLPIVCFLVKNKVTKWLQSSKSRVSSAPTSSTVVYQNISCNAHFYMHDAEKARAERDYQQGGYSRLSDQKTGQIASEAAPLVFTAD